METFFKDTLFSGTLRMSKEKSVGEYWKLLSQKQTYVDRFYQEVRKVQTQAFCTAVTAQQIWDGQGFDSIIAPVQAVPQLPHG